MERFERLGIAKPDILLPKTDTAYRTWAVIACDQFTHSRAYWDETRAIAGNSDSAYHIVLPEIDLDESGARVPLIHETMKRYLSDVLTRKVGGFTYVKRRCGEFTRRGVMLCVDLEAYDYRPEAKSLIRATEGTILERLPPRVAIRRGAAVETPHILLLIDDPKHTVIEPIDGRLEELPLLYDFELMQEGGHITSWELDPAEEARIVRALGDLLSPETQAEKYGEEAKDAPLLFAVGDGNHSLAAARACWMEIKGRLSPEARLTHPARWALVEVGNLHDEGLVFGPIHRALYGVDPHAALENFAAWLQDHRGVGGEQEFTLHYKDGYCELFAPNAPHMLCAGSLQGWIDEYLLDNTDASVDYIHGADEARKLAGREGCLTILLPAPGKEELFSSVMRFGPLPRKTFSMGEARQKRYYMECRAL